MTLRRFEYFVAVAEHGSFTIAAEQLAVSQPGLSHQLKALELELGGRLVDRGARRATLTPLGRAVLPHARAAVEQARRAQAAAGALLDGRAGTLRVSTVNSLSLAALPAVLAAWQSDHGGVEVHVQEHADVGPLLDAFADGAADLAVTPLPDRWDGEREPVGWEELVVVVPAAHPLAAVGRVDLRDLADQPWVHFAPDHGLAGVLEHLARLHGFRARAAMRTSQTAAAPRYVAAGVGFAILPANLVGEGCAGVHLDPPVGRTVYVVTRPDPDPLVRAFAEVVRTSIPLAPSAP